MTGDEALEQRRHAAFHEAAHAVLAYWFGWRVNYESVCIMSYGLPRVPDGGQDYTGMRCELWAYTLRARACVNAAGWLAETIIKPELSVRDDDDLSWAINEVRWQDESEDEGDHQSTFRALIGTHPDMSDEELIRAFRRYDAETLAILSRPEVWQSIQRVADALLTKGRLSGPEVEECLADDVRHGAFPPLDL